MFSGLKPKYIPDARVSMIHMSLGYQTAKHFEYQYRLPGTEKDLQLQATIGCLPVGTQQSPLLCPSFHRPRQHVHQMTFFQLYHRINLQDVFSASEVLQFPEADLQQNLEYLGTSPILSDWDVGVWGMLFLENQDCEDKRIPLHPVTCVQPATFKTGSICSN